MKVGTENRRQMIILGVCGTLALAAIYPLYEELFGGPPPATPASAPAPVIRDAAPPVTVAANGGASVLPPGREANALGPAPIGQSSAKNMGTTAQSLDPTLHMAAMLRTESLVYEGSGRNIFFAGAAPVKPAAHIEAVKFDPRQHPTGPIAAPPPPQPQGPPPIALRFFGTATSADGTRRAFLLNGDNVFLASAGDVVDRRYKVISIAANSIKIEDLTYSNRQDLPFTGQP